jgi:hypothetical protein
MNDRPMTLAERICAWLVVALLAGLVLGVYPGWPAVLALLKESQGPAWVQAVGSVAAIVVAIAIARNQAERDRRIRALQRADRYIELYAPVMSLGKEALRVLRTLYNEWSSGALFYERTGATDAKIWRESDLVVAQFAELKPTLLPTFDAIFAMRELRRLIETARDQLQTLANRAIQDARPAAERHLEFLNTLRDIETNLEALRSDLVKVSHPSE